MSFLCRCRLIVATNVRLFNSGGTRESSMSPYDIVENDDATCPSSSSRLFSASPFSLLLASSLKTLRVHDARAFPLSRLPSFAVVVARVIARVVLEDTQFCADDEEEEEEEEDGRHPFALKVVKKPALFENALTLRCCA